MPEEAHGNAVATVETPPAKRTVDSPAMPTTPPEAPRVTIPVQELITAVPDIPSRDSLIKSLVDEEIARQQYNQHYRLARTFAESGKFDDLKGMSLNQAIHTALAKMQIGAGLGLKPADSMQYVSFINSRPTLQNEIIASKMLDAGIGWDIQWHEITEQHEGAPWKRCVGCTLWLKTWSDREQKWLPMLDRDGNQVSESFTKGDADHAIIFEGGKQIKLSEKWNFKSWPRDMYFWRTIARVRRYHATNVLRGAVAHAEVWDVQAETFDQPELAAPEQQTEATDNQQPSLKDQLLRQAELLEEK